MTDEQRTRYEQQLASRYEGVEAPPTLARWATRPADGWARRAVSLGLSARNAGALGAVMAVIVVAALGLHGSHGGPPAGSPTASAETTSSISSTAAGECLPAGSAPTSLNLVGGAANTFYGPITVQAPPCCRRDTSVSPTVFTASFDGTMSGAPLHFALTLHGESGGLTFPIGFSDTQPSRWDNQLQMSSDRGDTVWHSYFGTATMSGDNETVSLDVGLNSGAIPSPYGPSSTVPQATDAHLAGTLVCGRTGSGAVFPGSTPG